MIGSRFQGIRWRIPLLHRNAGSSCLSRTELISLDGLYVFTKSSALCQLSRLCFLHARQGLAAAKSWLAWEKKKLIENTDHIATSYRKWGTGAGLMGQDRECGRQDCSNK